MVGLSQGDAILKGTLLVILYRLDFKQLTELTF